MARGIVEAIARAGQPVRALARSSGAADRMQEAIAGSLSRAVARGRIDDIMATAIRDRVDVRTEASVFDGAGVIIEAIVEDLPTKQRMMGELDTQLAAGVPMATNTSSYTVEEIFRDVDPSRPALALHFFNPAQAMRLVEVVGGASASADLVSAAEAWVTSIRKVPVHCADTRGFVVNRLLIPMLNDAVRLHETAVPIDDIEAAMVSEAGHPMGPFALMELIGIDVMVAALTALSAHDPSRIQPAETLLALQSEGRLGRKTGSGFLSEGLVS